MTRYQQKKKYLRCFHHFYVHLWRIIKNLLRGSNWSNFLQKTRKQKSLWVKMTIFFFIFQRQFFFYRKSIKKLVNLLMKFKYETFCPNFIHFRPPKISVMNYRPNEWSSHVRNYPPNQETAKNVDHARGSLHIFFLFSIMENFNLRVMRQRD